MPSNTVPCGGISNEQARLIEVLPRSADDLALVALPSFTPQQLRARFARDAEWLPEMLGDGQNDEWQLADSDYRQAAVLVPLVVRASGLTVLLTERNATMNAHAGQVSFPGGRRDPTDTSLTHTALREAEEEIGLHATHCEVLGALPPYLTISRFKATPVVALVHPPFELSPNPAEVADVFEVPLEFLTNPAHHQRRAREFMGKLRHFYAMPYAQSDGGERFIWGATAAMLRNFYHFLRAGSSSS